MPSISEIVVSDPSVLGGGRVFRGTRVPIEALFENLADGMALDDILTEFPTLDRRDIVALLQQMPKTLKTPEAA